MMKPEESSLLAVERQRIILEILDREGVVRNAELKELLSVTAATIRSDLRELENAGYCEIIWGGAVSKRPHMAGSERFLFERSKLNPEHKRRIGKRAAQLVEVGQTIIVDAGSTTVELIRHLPRDLEYLRVVTPALNVAAAAAHFPSIELVMTGGILRHLTWSLIGPQVVRALDIINADWAFLACGGFNMEQGMTTSNMLEVEIKYTMLKRAARAALLADSSKFNQTRSLTVAPLHELDVLITDTGLGDTDAARIAECGIEVIRV